ncbi:uncharacterized protein LOC132486834 [Mesoplodon densirostris]|uniref:uncharacterized protein LOC132486834 n=1 Tax=Mesoplodon densirostris TaxID=48708 RepID=UPI0028DB8269|nr:uncharacterized protein LOC132486834 [Mesoplodon densirostris]
MMFPKRAKRYLQHSQEGISADLVPEHLDITHLEASLCPLRPALQHHSSRREASALSSLPRTRRVSVDSSSVPRSGNPGCWRHLGRGSRGGDRTTYLGLQAESRRSREERGAGLAATGGDKVTRCGWRARPRGRWESGWPLAGAFLGLSCWLGSPSGKEGSEREEGTARSWTGEARIPQWLRGRKAGAGGCRMLPTHPWPRDIQGDSWMQASLLFYLLQWTQDTKRLWEGPIVTLSYTTLEPSAASSVKHPCYPYRQSSLFPPAPNIIL